MQKNIKIKKKKKPNILTRNIPQTRLDNKDQNETIKYKEIDFFFQRRTFAPEKKLTKPSKLFRYETIFKFYVSVKEFQ